MRQIALHLKVILFAIVLMGVSVFATALPRSERSGPVPGKFIIKLADGVREADIRAVAADNDRVSALTTARVSSRLIGSEQWERYRIYEAATFGRTAQEIEQFYGPDLVEWVEPDYYLEFFELPTDLLFDHQWYLHNTGQQYYGIDRISGYYNDTLRLTSGTAGKDIRIDTFYDNPPAETTRVVVAIVDSGVDTDHPELAGQIWRNPDEIAGNGIDDDHNGFVDDTIGYDVSGDKPNFLDPQGDNNPIDSNGHGTHLAGIVAARADGVGVVGAAPQVEIMAVKIHPNATSSVGAAGIVYAVNAGAQVINISWGSPFYSAVLKEALDFARINGVFVAIAPGNTGTNQRYYPAAYDSTFVVAAGNSDGFQTDWSTFGAHIDIVAPGRDILSLRAAGTDMYAAAGEPGVRIIGDDSLYYLADGTSMATPLVCAAAALLWSFRPQLSLDDIEDLLRFGATDLVDPWNQGDTLIGPDTISGWGYLNVEASMGLAQEGGLYIVEPVRRDRLTGDFQVLIAAVANYSGEWTLEYTTEYSSDDWLLLTQREDVPSDSIAYSFSGTDPEGNIRLRLTDRFGTTFSTSFVHVRHRKIEITSPPLNEELRYHVPIIGSAYGPDFDSVAVAYEQAGKGVTTLLVSTGEYFDSLLYDWPVSGGDTGQFVIRLTGYFQDTTIQDSTTVNVLSAFSKGFPLRLSGYGAISAVCCDLDGDGVKELAVGTSRGLHLWEITSDGPQSVIGFPALINNDVRCVPAVYDIDRDGLDEIIVTSSDGIHVLKHDGSYASGWPRECYTGFISNGYGYPIPTVTQLGMGEDSAIVIINILGQILAWEFNGDSYFYSLKGRFADFDPRISDSHMRGGSTSPLVTVADLDGNGLREVVAMYYSPEPYSGVGVFDSRTGQPEFDPQDPIIMRINQPYGTMLADLDGNSSTEIVTLGYDSDFSPSVWIKTNGTDDFSGWPIHFPERAGWLASYPVGADLDLDGIPEILFTFFEYDITSLYIFRVDGSPYIEREGRPVGEAFFAEVTFSTPTVANCLGDKYPEIIIRSGYILPGTGPEQIYLFDHLIELVPGFPVQTPGSLVMSTCYVPLVDDVDGDGLVEMVLVSDAHTLLMWDFEASVDGGRNMGRFLYDNLNSAILPTVSESGK